MKFLLPIFLLLAFDLSGQSYSIDGRVLSEGKPVEFGNAVLLHTGDSSLIAGTSISNGILHFDSVQISPVILRINVPGNKPSFRLIEKNAGETKVSLGDLSLEASILAGVEIDATLPVIQKKEGTMRINVESTMLSAAGTTQDILESSPGILVSPDGTVTVLGKGAALVLLDGQRVPVDIIKSLPSSQIRYIEIIDHPPASYDAQGRAVVNIVTRKNALEGYQLNFVNALSLGLAHQNMYTYDGVNFYYRKKKISLLSRYGYFGGSRFNSTEYLRDYSNSAGNVTMRNYLEQHQKFRNASAYGLGVRYEIDSIRTTELFYNGDYTDLGTDKMDTNLVRMGSQAYQLLALTHAGSIRLNHNLNWAYTVKPDTLGSKREWNISASQYHSNNEDRIQETFVDSSSTDFLPKRSLGTNTIGILSLKGDMAKAFTPKTILEYGGKALVVRNSGDVHLSRNSNGSWVDDSTLSNGYRYDEQTAALYVQATFRPGKWMIRPGIRGEYAHTRGFSERLNKVIIDTNYVNVFPTVFAEYEIKKDWKANANYAFRINRPSFQDLDPFVTYIDSLSALIGNPALRPELIHESSASLVYLDAASIEVEYAYTKNSINTFVVRTPGSDMFYGQERNFKKADAINISLDLPYENKWWTMSNSFGYAYARAHYQDQNTTAENSGELWYAFFYQQFRFLKRWSVEAMFSYNKGGTEGVFTGGENYWLRLALAYKSANGNITARLMTNDILNSNVTIGYSNIPGFDLVYKERYDSQFVRAVVSWKIGRLKNEFSEKGINSEERNRIKSR